MSEIRIHKVAKQDGSKSVDTDYVIDGSAKAILHYEQISSIVHLSSNVSSVVDTASATYQMNLTNAMAGTRNVISGSAMYGANSGYYNYNMSGFFISQSQVHINSFESSGASRNPLGECSALIHGDLA